jgi:hypothetical protein
MNVQVTNLTVVARVILVTTVTPVTELTSVPIVILPRQKCFRPADVSQLLQLRRLAACQHNYIRIACYEVLSKSNKTQSAFHV